MSEPRYSPADVKALTARVAQLASTLEQFVAAVDKIKDVLMFGEHPELVALDDELDTLYRGQL